MEILRLRVEYANLGERAAEVDHQHLLVLQILSTVDADIPPRLLHDLFIDRLGRLGDIQVFIGLADLLVEEPGTPFADHVDPLNLVPHLDAVELLNHTATVDDLRAALADHLIPFVQHRDLRRLEQAHLERQLQRIGADHPTMTGGIVCLVDETQQHALIVALPLLGVLSLLGLRWRYSPLEEVVHRDRPLVPPQQREVEDVVHRPPFQLSLPIEQPRVRPDVRTIILTEVFKHLLHNIAAFDDVLSLGFVVRL